MLAKTETPRTALARHLDNVAQAAAEVARLSKPVATLQARAEAAEAAQRDARAEHARLSQQHADALTQWANAGATGEVPKASESARADAVAKIENAIQVLGATRAALAEATEPLD